MEKSVLKYLIISGKRTLSANHVNDISTQNLKIPINGIWKAPASTGLAVWSTAIAGYRLNQANNSATIISEYSCIFLKILIIIFCFNSDFSPNLRAQFYTF